MGGEWGHSEGGGDLIYGKKGHIVTRSTALVIATVLGGSSRDQLNDRKGRLIFKSLLDGIIGSDLWEYSGIDSEHPDAHQQISQEILRDSIARSRTHQLPLELKKRGEERIRRVVPWHRKLFK